MRASNDGKSNHNNGFDYSGWKTEQYNLKRQMILRDHNLTFDPKNLDKTLKLIGGVDISFENGNSNRAIATLIVLSFPDLKIVHEESEQVEMTLPYIAGYLAFREVPHIQRLIENVRNKVPHMMPQVILVDGNGHLHQRGFGSACHLGVVENIPTIGVAKKILMVKGLTDEYIDGLEQQLTRKGECIDIDIDSEKRIGCILKTDNITNVYISPGHRVCLDTAVSIVKRCSLKSIPEPIYQADLISRNHVKKYFKKSKNPRRY
ncbi:predicted protein [Naegleria gruberi]|uniref:Predicted protein n=1 Tax=Naegleria gruberi TaxID=5762 RepID=D2V8A0_NAEGR|nr:uncharacterized protein NAEGRDRAFT_31961 [Naegleria gruberi]EFC47141.1 predicted protein [Naegleria gruberi]|eukprot:XP_002679885.1 predicted protein [Naegleria gruberi strain NEG-M]